MNKMRLKQIVGVGIFWGLLFAMQQAVVSVIVASVQEFGGLPFLSVVALSFLFVTTSLLMVAVLWLASAVFSRIKAVRRLEGECWFGILSGVAVWFWGFCFVFYKYKWMFGGFISVLLLVLITLFLGAVFGLMVGSTAQFVLRRAKIGNLVKVFAIRLTGVGIGLWLVSVGLLVVVGGKHYFYGRPGLVLTSDERGVSEKPNIVLVTVDTLRADSFNSEKMPEVYEFAKKGAVFTNAYSPAPWTLPSFVSIFSSKSPSEVRVSVENFGKEEISKTHGLSNELYTLAEELKDKGFLTQAIVTNRVLVSKVGFGQGFDGFVHLEDVKPYHWHYNIKNMVTIKVLEGLPVVGDRVKLVYDLLVGKTSIESMRTRAGEVSDLALDWLEKRDKDQPFFLWLHYIDPHRPFSPVKEFSPELGDITFEQEQMLRGYGIKTEDIRWRRTAREAVKKLYDGEVRYMDSEVGRLLDYFEESGLVDSTIVVFGSDHGEEFLEHGNLGHGRTLYNELVSVPLMVRYDGQVESGEIEKLVSLTDLRQTLLGFLGEESELGRDWFSEEYKDRVFVEANFYGLELKGVLWNGWKLIWEDEFSEMELFDLKFDEEEKMNVVSANPRVAGKLKDWLIAWVEESRGFYKEWEESGGFGEAAGFGEIVGY